MTQQLTFNVDLDTQQAINGINRFFDTFEQGAFKAKSRLQQEWQKPIELDVEVKFKNGKLVSESIQSMRNDSKKLGDVWEAVNGKLGKSAKELTTQKKLLTELIAKTNKFSKDNKSINKDYQLLQSRLKQVNQALKLQETAVIRIKGAWKPVNEEIKRSVKNLREAARASRDLGKGGGGTADLQNQFRNANVQSQIFVEGLKRAANAVIEFGRTGAQFQLLSTQLRAFAADTEEAEQLFQKFKTTAIRTPFTLSQVAEAGKILLAFGVDADTATEALDRLAIIASATGGQIDLLARNLGQIESQGRAFTRDLNQFAIQGIPIWTALSEVTGKNVVQLREMAREGTIGFNSVNDALANLTDESGAFAAIAGDIQTTWIGLTQRLITEIQDTAKEFVEFVDAVDEATQGSIKGSLKFLADSVRAIGIAFDVASGEAGFFAETLENTLVTSPVIGNLTRVLGLFDRLGINLSNANGRLAEYGRNIAGAFGQDKNAILERQAQLLFDQAKNVKEVSKELLVEEEVVKRLYSDWEALTEAEQQSLKVLNTRAEAARKQMEFEKENLQSLIEKVKERYQTEIEEAEKTRERIRQDRDDEKQRYDELVESIKARYEIENRNLDTVIDKRKQSFADELSFLNKKTPAEKRLLEIRRAELRERANNSQLSEKERVSAQAQLDAMNRQVKVAAARKKFNEENKKLQEQKKQLQIDEKNELAEAKRIHKEKMDEMQQDLDEAKNKIKELKSERDKEIQSIKDAVKYNGDVKDSVDNTTQAVNNQIGRVIELTDKYQMLAIEAAKAERAMRSANQQRSQAAGGGGGIPNNFAGGPIAGGQKTYINEMGQEAFLSASGKLSMIDAAPWSVWKAPGAGTIIPAHVAQGLNIPSGGVNVNRGANSQVHRAASGGGSIASALRGLTGGSSDRITNNVTIQAANTTQAASDMMVRLNRIRRNRYS